MRSSLIKLSEWRLTDTDRWQMAGNSYHCDEERSTVTTTSANVAPKRSREAPRYSSRIAVKLQKRR